jgi:succinate dehydrogenase/fumarate reductase cytochrome b subunit
MKNLPLGLIAICLIPMVSEAQTLQQFIPSFTTFLGNVIVPFLLGIAFLIFVINAIRFFVIESNNEDGQKKAKSLMTWSILAFTLIIVFWGVINIIGGSLGFGDDTQPISDYIQR